ncbi:ER lumen protein retaining receptor family protein [Artemisia annua]|uniref:ER lumen protein retaining receptor family protein n=1 Tax=Artemisia annua TaxID=35608 RepID=A0A2U1LCM8_ARTAN|nr:ER lumen protein retaining receptor family protein [Artemisia annua]
MAEEDKLPPEEGTGMCGRRRRPNLCEKLRGIFGMVNEIFGNLGTGSLIFGKNLGGHVVHCYVHLPETQHSHVTKVMWPFCVHLEATAVLHRPSMMQVIELAVAHYMLATGVTRSFGCAHWVIQIICHKVSGSRGLGFVTMSSVEDVREGVTKFNSYVGINEHIEPMRNRGTVETAAKLNHSNAYWNISLIGFREDFPIAESEGAPPRRHTTRNGHLPDHGANVISSTTAMAIAAADGNDMHETHTARRNTRRCRVSWCCRARSANGVFLWGDVIEFVDIVTLFFWYDESLKSGRRLYPECHRCCITSPDEYQREASTKRLHNITSANLNDTNIWPVITLLDSFAVTLEKGSSVSHRSNWQMHSTFQGMLNGTGQANKQAHSGPNSNQPNKAHQDPTMLLEASRTWREDGKFKIQNLNLGGNGWNILWHSPYALEYSLAYSLCFGIFFGIFLML